jgi:hypothetical protein
LRKLVTVRCRSNEADGGRFFPDLELVASPVEFIPEDFAEKPSGGLLWMKKSIMVCCRSNEVGGARFSLDLELFASPVGFIPKDNTFVRAFNSAIWRSEVFSSSFCVLAWSLYLTSMTLGCPAVSAGGGRLYLVDRLKPPVVMQVLSRGPQHVLIAN